MKYLLSILCLFIFSCDDDSPTAPNPILGCMDDTACNYDETATVDDDTCLELDCNDECGGDSIVDECGECGGDGAIYECGCSDIADGACDCDGNVEDCTGFCGGIAIENECGCIVGCYQDTDCSGSYYCYIYDEVFCLPPNAGCAPAAGDAETNSVFVYGFIPNDGTTAGFCYQGNVACPAFVCDDFCSCGCPTFQYHSLY